MTTSALLRRPISTTGQAGELAEQPWWRRPRTLLVVVAVLHALSPLVLLGVHWWFGVDETVYLSQINAHVPAGYFSAPRARGATLIAAPITSWTDSVAAVRVWVTALSGVALYAGFAPWLRLRSGYLVPLAALMVSTLWTVTYYGFEVMPNEWVAFAAVGTCGYALRYLDEGRRRQLVAVGLAALWIALLRPSDALFAGGALGVCVLLVKVPLRRRLRVVAALVLGAGIGIGEWVVEAQTSYGGLMARVHASQAEQGGGGLHFAGAAQARTLAGPVLCRAGCAADAPVAYQLWWVVAAVLVAIGVIATRRRAEVIMVVVALAMASQYVFTVTYAAPRFLIPTYALLSLPAAAGAIALLRAVRRSHWRRLLQVVLIGGLVANTALQAHVIVSNLAPATRTADRAVLGDAAALHRLGVGQPCLLIGHVDNLRLSYATACSNSARTPAAVRSDLAHGTRVVWLRGTTPSRSYRVHWRRVLLPGETKPRIAYLSGARLPA
ncbi:hypothetical protein [Jatrophihabitans sp.]|uniref:hypothetical protein n=1 Tax=Jatrophihabitans sp. TaxID=1932789 RepID=UPI0030C6E42B|nr:hypothetical protein [Jatrophihabitans sp.]